MPKARLNRTLLEKLVKRTGKSEQYLREQISKRASRLGVPSEVAQILWAMELGMGTASALRTLPPHMQEQVQAALPSAFARARREPARHDRRRRQARRDDPIRLAIQYLLTDDELRERCADLIRARRHFDRAFREATTVLEDRVRQLSGVKGLTAVPLMGKVLNPKSPMLVVSQEPHEREGFFHVCRGLMLAFRDRYHHQLSDKLTREDALRFCGFVDSLLTLLNGATKSP